METLAQPSLLVDALLKQRSDIQCNTRIIIDAESFQTEPDFVKSEIFTNHRQAAITIRDTGNRNTTNKKGKEVSLQSVSLTVWAKDHSEIERIQAIVQESLYHFVRSPYWSNSQMERQTGLMYVHFTARFVVFSKPKSEKD